MTAIPILNGVYTSAQGDFVASYPINREPVVQDSGMIAKGFLRPAAGVTQIGTGPGADRGGINWNGTCYRVMGGKLVSVSSAGIVTELGDIAGTNVCAFDYSFDRLGINGGGNLYYFQGSVSQVTDPDLGTVIDMLWMDGHFMMTDGEFIVVTELNDPTQINPLKYGSSEESPDPVTGLMKLRGELYACNRLTIEVFEYVGGNGFPLQRNASALIEKGCVGPRAKAYIGDTFAFVGGGRNEAVGVYLAGPGQAAKISTQEIDELLASLSEDELYQINAEARIDKDEQRLLVHLPTTTCVFYVNASAAAGEKVWAYVNSGLQFEDPYGPRNAVWCYSRWVVGDENGRIGQIDYSVSTLFGEVAGWRFDTKLLYNGGAYAILGAVELVGNVGRGGRIFFSSTVDGRTWSLEQSISGGAIGQRAQRLQWRPGRRFQQWMGLRFRGADDGTDSFARLEADIEALA